MVKFHLDNISLIFWSISMTLSCWSLPIIRKEKRKCKCFKISPAIESLRKEHELSPRWSPHVKYLLWSSCDPSQYQSFGLSRRGDLIRRSSESKMLETPLLTTFATESIARSHFPIWKMLSTDICKESLSTNHLFDTCAGAGSAEISIERWTSWVKFWAGERHTCRCRRTWGGSTF